VALYRDLRNDPLIRRDDRSQEAIEQAVEYGMKEHDGDFVLNVKPLTMDEGADEANTRGRTVLPGGGERNSSQT
jgi:hypothetical protein